MGSVLGDNICLWLKKDGTLSAKTIDTGPAPGPGEATIRVLFSGINPADIKHATLGLHSSVSGYDYCGIVEACGPDFPFEVGTTVAGLSPAEMCRLPTYGAHQDYMTCNTTSAFVWRVPQNVPPSHAACMTVVVSTAADALFNLFRFPLPGSSAADVSLPILIWSGSSSVGIAAIQFAKAIGMSPVLVTASPAQHETLLRLGATKCFDYKDPGTVDAIRSCIKTCGRLLKHIIDAAGVLEARTADLAASFGDAAAEVLTVVFHPKFRMPFGNTMVNTQLDVVEIGPVTVPARPADAKRAQAAVLWAVEHYGNGFELPRVEIVEGQVDTAIAAISAVGKGTSSHGKYVVKHPLYC
jgi:NADPH:quinone reductase-like Zn-dependent oxidoreductase